MDPRTTLPPSPQPPVREGDVLAGKYVVERVLGMGGMGVVVAAHHRHLGGRVALKFMLPSLATSGHVVRRFMREARAASSITSEHVARVSDVGTLDRGEPYIVMEYLEGHDLARELALNGPLPIASLVDHVMQALQAVAEAHAKGIVHRDLKPSNLFVTRRADGTPLVKVLDFGIAKARPTSLESPGVTGDSTGTAPLVGSPCYVSPEQIRSPNEVDARTDVWAVGVMLYELLTGEVPFIADELGGVVAAILTDPPVPIRRRRPDVPAGLERVVMACLEKQVVLRTATVADLAAGLAPFGTDDSKLSQARIAGIAAGGAPPPRQRAVRNSTKLGALTLVLAASGALFWVVMWRSNGERPASNPRTSTNWPSVRPASEPPAVSPLRAPVAPAPLPPSEAAHGPESPTPAPRKSSHPAAHAKRHAATSRRGTDRPAAPDLEELIKDRK